MQWYEAQEAIGRGVIADLWQDKKDNLLLWDVVLVGDDGTEVHANRLGLAQFSGYFRQKFCSDFSDRQDCTLHLPGVPGEALRKVVKSWFTRAEVFIGSMDDIEDCLELAEYLQIDALKATCEQFMRDHMLQVESVCKAYAIAQRYNCTSFLEVAEAFMCDNFPCLAVSMALYLPDSHLPRVLAPCIDKWSHASSCDVPRDLHAALNGKVLDYNMLWQQVQLNRWPNSEGTDVLAAKTRGGRRVVTEVDGPEECNPQICVDVLKAIFANEKLPLSTDNLGTYLETARKMRLLVDYDSPMGWSLVLLRDWHRFILQSMLTLQHACRALRISLRYNLLTKHVAEKYVARNIEAIMQNHMASFAILSASTIRHMFSTDQLLAVDSELTLLEWLRLLQAIDCPLRNELTVESFVGLLQVDESYFGTAVKKHLFMGHPVFDNHEKAYNKLIVKMALSTGRATVRRQRKWSGPIGYVPYWCSPCVPRKVHMQTYWRIQQWSKTYGAGAGQPPPDDGSTGSRKAKRRKAEVPDAGPTFYVVGGKHTEEWQLSLVVSGDVFIEIEYLGEVKTQVDGSIDDLRGRGGNWCEMPERAFTLCIVNQALPELSKELGLQYKGCDGGAFRWHCGNVDELGRDYVMDDTLVVGISATSRTRSDCDCAARGGIGGSKCSRCCAAAQQGRAIGHGVADRVYIQAPLENCKRMPKHADDVMLTI